MEIVDLIWALIQGCGCFLEAAAAGTDIGAGVAGYQAAKDRKARRAARQEKSPDDEAAPDEKPAPGFGSTWLFFILLCAGVSLTFLTLWKWLQ